MDIALWDDERRKYHVWRVERVEWPVPSLDLSYRGLQVFLDDGTYILNPKGKGPSYWRSLRSVEHKPETTVRRVE